MKEVRKIYISPIITVWKSNFMESGSGNYKQVTQENNKKIIASLKIEKRIPLKYNKNNNKWSAGQIHWKM